MSDWTQLEFDFVGAMPPRKPRFNLEGLKETILEAELERLRTRETDRLMRRFERAAERRRQAISEAEAAGQRVWVESVRADRVGGSWKVTAKGQHDSLGPVYRHGYVVTLLELGELLQRWNERDEWTKDKYRK